MVDSVLTRAAEATTATERDVYLKAFRWMLLARTLDEKLASLYPGGKIPGGGVYLGKGQEALTASIGMALNKQKVFFPLNSEGASRLAFWRNRWWKTLPNLSGLRGRGTQAWGGNGKVAIRGPPPPKGNSAPINNPISGGDKFSNGANGGGF